ncbi:hypothetical protein [Gordonia sp. ABSL49_1]|nr:hypothetical protein [Gordonia sp. ABSL49_1]
MEAIDRTRIEVKKMAGPPTVAANKKLTFSFGWESHELQTDEIT